MADFEQEKELVTELDEAPDASPESEQDETQVIMINVERQQDDPPAKSASKQDEAPVIKIVVEHQEDPDSDEFGSEQYDASSGYGSSGYEDDISSLSQKEFIREQIRLSRREWFNDHKTIIFAAVGILLAALIFLGIRIYIGNNNPASWLVQASSMDFGTSFDFEVTLSEDEASSMKYTGSADFDRSHRTAEVLYDAEYSAYSYTGALYAANDKAFTGTLYKGKWVIDDCTEQVRDFFALDKSLKNGDLDAGALLRFLGMTSELSSNEVDRFSKKLAGMLASDSALATVKASAVDGGTRYTYEISVNELFRMIEEDGAPLFFHSSGYIAFKERYDANKRSLKDKVCKMSYVIDSSGYLSDFGMEIEADDTLFRLDCKMSNFGEAQVELPAEFLEAAGVTEEK